MSTSEGGNYGAIKARKKIKMKRNGVSFVVLKNGQGGVIVSLILNTVSVRCPWDLHTDVKQAKLL